MTSAARAGVCAKLIETTSTPYAANRSSVVTESVPGCDRDTLLHQWLERRRGCLQLAIARPEQSGILAAQAQAIGIDLDQQIIAQEGQVFGQGLYGLRR